MAVLQGAWKGGEMTHEQIETNMLDISFLMNSHRAGGFNDCVVIVATCTQAFVGHTTVRRVTDVAHAALWSIFKPPQKNIDCYFFCKYAGVHYCRGKMQIPPQKKVTINVFFSI